MCKTFMPKTSEALLREIKDLKNGGDSILVDVAIFSPLTSIIESVKQRQKQSISSMEGIILPILGTASDKTVY